MSPQDRVRYLTGSKGEVGGGGSKIPLFHVKVQAPASAIHATTCASVPYSLIRENSCNSCQPMLAANAFLKINARKVRNALAANNPVVPDPATLLPDAGLPTSSPGRACPAARATSASPRAPARTLPRAYLSSSSSPEKVAEIGCHHAPRTTHHFPKNTPKTA